MVRLSARDFELIISLLPTLYAPTDAASFPFHSLHVLHVLIPADDLAWIGFEMETRPTVKTWIALTRRIHRELLGRGLASYPASQPLASSADGIVVSVLATHPPRGSKSFAMCDAMMAFVEVRARRALAVTLSRKARGFNERDRAMLALIRDHLRWAHANARQLEPRIAGTPIPDASTNQFSLTPRECDVSFWLSHGKTNAEIATILHIGSRTAEKHVEGVLRKLMVENRTSAAVLLCGANDGGPTRQRTDAQRVVRGAQSRRSSRTHGPHAGPKSVAGARRQLDLPRPARVVDAAHPVPATRPTRRRRRPSATLGAR